MRPPSRGLRGRQAPAGPVALRSPSRVLGPRQRTDRAPPVPRIRGLSALAPGCPCGQRCGAGRSACRVDRTAGLRARAATRPRLLLRAATDSPPFVLGSPLRRLQLPSHRLAVRVSQRRIRQRLRLRAHHQDARLWRGRGRACVREVAPASCVRATWRCADVSPIVRLGERRESCEFLRLGRTRGPTADLDSRTAAGARVLSA